VGAINAVQSLGKQIPEDYSLVGVALGGKAISYPPVTSIPWRGNEIGEMAARILIDKLKYQKARKITHITFAAKDGGAKSTRPRELIR